MPVPCDHDAYPVYAKIIGPVRKAAHKLGYAIAVHGTVKRDIDLVAIPWTRDAAPAAEVAEAVRSAIDTVMEIVVASRMQMAVWRNNGLAYNAKPHGRRVWNYYFDADCVGPYLDLGVMPREADRG